MKAFPQWDFLIHIPEEEWTSEWLLNAKPGEVDGCMRYVAVELIEGSEGYPDEGFRDRCVELVENIIADLRSVSDAIGGFEDEKIEVGDSVLVTGEDEERFEGTVVDALNGMAHVVGEERPGG